jgi:hypothetical protein
MPRVPAAEGAGGREREAFDALELLASRYEVDPEIMAAKVARDGLSPLDRIVLRNQIRRKAFGDAPKRR